VAVTPDLVCVGHVVREMISFPDGVKGPFLGSPPAYCSVAAARQGTTTGLVTVIGPDMPQALLQPITDAGVDTRGIRRGKCTTASELIYDAQGDKEIQYPAKAKPIKAYDIPEAYAGCQIIYVCTMDRDVLPEDLDSVVALGKISAVDLGGYGGAHMSKANREAVASLEELACGVAERFNIVKASDEDARTIFGWDDPLKAAQVLLSRGSEVVVITLGSKGGLVCSSEERMFVPPLPCNAIDTTGGGDVFMAGFLSEYLRSEDPVRATQWGSATAAYVIEQTGGVRVERMPAYRQVQERVKSYSETR